MLQIAVTLLLASSSSVAQASPELKASGWILNSTKAGAYTLAANGRATDPSGATISLSAASDPSSTFGSATAQLSAESLHGRRVTVSGELQTRGVARGATLWLRIDGGSTMLLFDADSLDAVRGDADWTPRSLSLPVPPEATSLSFGLRLVGGGSAAVRQFRFTASAPIAENVPLATEAQDVLNAALSLVKKNSLHRDDLDWDVVEPRVRSLAAGAEKSADVYPAIRYLLGRLGDHHSSLMVPRQASQFQTGGAQNPSPEVRITADRVGYVNVPGYGGADASAIQAYTTRTYAAFDDAVAGAVCGWIVDLRRDTGGNMWPMLAGLQPFLGTGSLGTFEGPTGSSGPWIAGQRVGVTPPSTLDSLEAAWVAVLTGPRTASSGEAVAIAFRGRAHTRSFGQPTAGLSTANGTFRLPDGALLLLTTAVDADRTGRRYGDKIEPDERVEDTGNDDAAVSAASKWLTQSSGCSAISPGGR